MNIYYSYYLTTHARAVTCTHRREATLEAAIFLTILYMTKKKFHAFLSTVHFSLFQLKLYADVDCTVTVFQLTLYADLNSTLTQSFLQTFSTSTVNSLIMASVACNMLRCI